MNKDLFLALLAMDSYDRGYGEAVRVNGCKIGESIFSIQSNITEDSGAVLAGFYASAYIVNGVEGIADGTVVISYRGTGTSTFWDGTWPDIVHGWPMGAGLQPDQADLALSFYEAVTRALVDAKRDQASDLTDRRRIYCQATAARRGQIFDMAHELPGLDVRMVCDIGATIDPSAREHLRAFPHVSIPCFEAVAGTFAAMTQNPAGAARACRHRIARAAPRAS